MSCIYKIHTKLIHKNLIYRVIYHNFLILYHFYKFNFKTIIIIFYLRIQY